MDDLEGIRLKKLQAAYSRIRVCRDIRDREHPMDLAEIERLEREALEAHDRAIQGELPLRLLGRR